MTLDVGTREWRGEHGRRQRLLNECPADLCEREMSSAKEEDIVVIMKNYMANKSFSRGVEQITAEASMAFLGNTSHEVGYLLKNSDLFDDLPELYHDPAFLDRFHAYVPG